MPSEFKECIDFLYKVKIDETSEAIGKTEVKDVFLENHYKLNSSRKENEQNTKNTIYKTTAIGGGTFSNKDNIVSRK